MPRLLKPIDCEGVCATADCRDGVVEADWLLPESSTPCVATGSVVATEVAGVATVCSEIEKA